MSFISSSEIRETPGLPLQAGGGFAGVHIFDGAITKFQVHEGLCFPRRLFRIGIVCYVAHLGLRAEIMKCLRSFQEAGYLTRRAVVPGWLFLFEQTLLHRDYLSPSA